MRTRIRRNVEISCPIFAWAILSLALGVLCVPVATVIAQPPSGGPAVSNNNSLEKPPARNLDDATIRAAGIRKLVSQHLTLYTDVGSSPAIDELPAVFDLAFPQWCAYFGRDEKKLTDWRINAFLMADKERFRPNGFLPDDLPGFLNGRSRGHEFWFNEQTTNFYRRHLLLHEGTHCFMETQFGSCGPPWYMEGMAELLGTHRWENGKLALGIIPASRTDSPGWGRIKYVKEGFAANGGQTLGQIFAFPGNAYLKTEPYDWSWGLATFFDGHPKYRERFRSGFSEVTERDFSTRFQARFKDDWPRIQEEWQLFIGTMEYGHDLSRTVIDFAPGKPLPAAGDKIVVAADQGWQNSGVVVEAGKKYRLKATGRFQVVGGAKPWLSEANGVSLRYYRGNPLGVLLAAVRTDPFTPSETSGLLQPTVVGLTSEFTPKKSGTLYFKVNDSPAELADNTGTLTVDVTSP